MLSRVHRLQASSGGGQLRSMPGSQARIRHGGRRPLRVDCSLRFFTPLGSGSNAKTSNSGRFVSSLQSQAEREKEVLRAATQTAPRTADSSTAPGRPGFQGVHHVGLLCQNLEASLVFYKDVLGLEENPDRPHSRLPYRGAWLWIGPEMIHLMELPDPDPKDGRPEHGGRDRHFCLGISAVQPLVDKLEASGTAYTMSKSGRPAVFFRDPDMNCLEVAEMGEWR